MPTTQKTQQTSQFDPGSMQQFKGLQGGIGNVLGGYMTNPFGNPFFQAQQQMGTRQAQNLGGTGTSNLLRNMTASNMFGGASSPAGLEMLQNQGRANTGLQAQLGFLQPLMNALGMQQWATGAAEQYRPLQTGSTQTQSTSGLGTWLPQVAGLAMAPFTGGMSMLPGMMGGSGGLGGLFGGGGGMAGTGSFGSNYQTASPFSGGGYSPQSMAASLPPPGPPQ